MRLGTATMKQSGEEAWQKQNRRSPGRGKAGRAPSQVGTGEFTARYRGCRVAKYTVRKGREVR